VISPFAAIATSSTIAPRIEIYTTLACSILRPDHGESPQQPDILGFLHSNDCIFPAASVAHQSSCMDISDVFMTDKSLQTNNTVDTPPTRKQRCASDPVVQAAVAKLTSRAYSFFVNSTCTWLLVARCQALEELPTYVSLRYDVGVFL
jgi:hypothetical protein